MDIKDRTFEFAIKIVKHWRENLLKSVMKITYFSF